MRGRICLEQFLFITFLSDLLNQISLEELLTPENGNRFILYEQSKAGKKRKFGIRFREIQNAFHGLPDYLKVSLKRKSVELIRDREEHYVSEDVLSITSGVAEDGEQGLNN